MLGSFKKLALLSTSLAATVAGVGAATPAAAQQAQEDDVVVVTAQKREQNIQDVPIAVTALSANALEQGGVADIRALQTLSASINLNSSQTESGGTTMRIRGVGTTGNNAGLESSVGVFIDGVYISRPAIALGELLDVQQIEILRGPQGTLFGRNTSAGAVTIVTRAPDLTEFGAFGNMTIGALGGGDLGGLLSTQAGVNLPLVEDKLAVRFSAGGRVRDGLLTSTTGAEQNSRDRYLLRGQALWAPTDDISVRVIADYAEGNDDCCDGVIVLESPFVASGAYLAAGLGANGGASASGFGALGSRTSNASLFKDPGQQTGFSVQVDWEIGGADLTYIGSTRNALSGPNVQDSDFVSTNVFQVGGDGAPAAGTKNNGRVNYDSHELRLSGEAGRLQWMVGAYYGEESISSRGALSLGTAFQANINANLYGIGGGPAGITALFTPSLGAPGAAAFAANPAAAYAMGASSTGAFAFNVFTQEGETTSVFTHNTLSITDNWDVTVGARFVDESKHGVFRQPAAQNQACANAIANPLTAATGTFGAVARAFLCFPFATPVGLTGGPALFDRNFEDEELVYTANTSYGFTGDIRGYVSFTHGFKSGGFNLDPTAAIGGASPAFRSEKVDAYEIGLKSELFDGRLRANVAVFRSDIEDFQVLEFTGVQFVTFNVPKVESTGAEFEFQGKLTDTLGASLALTYTDAHYPADCSPNVAAPTAVQRAALTLCGSTLTNAPEFVGILGLNYDTPVGPSHRVYASGSVRYETDRRVGTQEFAVNAAAPFRTVRNPVGMQEANAKTNLRFGFGSLDESWGIELWGTNIFDEQTFNVAANTPLRGVSAATNSRVAFIEEPAIYGVTIRANY